jgi:hypothetical protein
LRKSILSSQLTLLETLLVKVLLKKKGILKEMSADAPEHHGKTQPHKLGFAHSAKNLFSTFGRGKNPTVPEENPAVDNASHVSNRKESASNSGSIKK